MPAYRTKLERNGRVVLPAPVRKQLGIQPGDEIVMITDDKGVYVTAADTSLRVVRERVRAWVPEGVSLADDVIALRRKDGRKR